MNDEKKYKMNDILNSRYHYDKLQYKVVWTNHSSNKAWYLTKNFEHFKNIFKNYHQRYFEKFESETKLIVIVKAMLSQWIKNEHTKMWVHLNSWHATSSLWTTLMLELDDEWFLIKSYLEILYKYFSSIFTC
jgi:hypothetical protein